MKVVILEDDKRLNSFLKSSFSRTDWELCFCGDIDELDGALAVAAPDVLVLDRMIGSRDSLAHLAEWKRRHPQTRVIFLSALDSTDEKVRALQSGADDYLAKPFSVSELEARIEALGRRTGSPSQEQSAVLQVADLKVDRLAHQASIGGRRLQLTAKEFKLLQILAARPSVVFSKIQLMDQVWDVNAEIDSNVVEVTIRNLRRKLEEARARVRICTQRSVGYWLEA
jgi:two-component system copper resistance phosphate regulon response regulator CusR